MTEYFAGGDGTSNETVTVINCRGDGTSNDLRASLVESLSLKIPKSFKIPL